MKIKTFNELICEKSCYPLNTDYKKFCIEKDFSDSAINEIREHDKDRHWLYLVDRLISSLFLPNLNVFKMLLEEFHGRLLSDKIRTDVYKEILIVALAPNSKEIRPEAISIFCETTGVSVKEFLVRHKLSVYQVNNIAQSPLKALMDYSNNPFFEDACKVYKKSTELKSICSLLNTFQETTHMATWLLSDIDCRDFIDSLNDKDFDYNSYNSYLLAYLILADKYHWRVDDAIAAINYKSYELLSIIDDYLIIDDELAFVSKLANSLMDDLFSPLTLNMIDYSKSDEEILKATNEAIVEDHTSDQLHYALDVTLTILTIRKRKARLQSIIDSWLKEGNFPKVLSHRVSEFERIEKFLKIIQVDFDTVKFQELVSENRVF